MKQSNQNKDETLESKVKKTRLRSLITAGMGLVAAGMITFLGYNNWRNQPVFHDDLNAVAPRSFNLESITEANQFLLDFPSEIPGASSVDKYITPDARYTLVHIRQTHDEDGILKIIDSVYDHFFLGNMPVKTLDNLKNFIDIYDAFIRTINLVEDIANNQKNIHDIVDQITDNHPDVPIFLEGYAIEDRQQVENFTNLTDMLYESISTRLINNQHYAQDIRTALSFMRLHRNSIDNQQDGMFETYDEIMEKSKEYTKIIDRAMYYPGGTELLSRKKYLNLHPAETAEAHSSINREEYTADMSEKREDAALQLISDLGSTYSIIIYGAAHAWGGNKSFGRSYPTEGRLSMKDNIAEWNKRNPDKKFSLIEITPESHIKREY
ncbi:MAG: hypothetical protein ACMXYG_03030 [Candidatus Woesearchaeota archaeon]